MERVCESSHGTWSEMLYSEYIDVSRSFCIEYVSTCHRRISPATMHSRTVKQGVRHLHVGCIIWKQIQKRRIYYRCAPARLTRPIKEICLFPRV
jgi:hypothetical protein